MLFNSSQAIANDEDGAEEGPDHDDYGDESSP